MKLEDLERVETELGLDLPEDYRQFILQLRLGRDPGRMPIENALLQSFLVTRPVKLIRLNERVADNMPIAGLRRWPASYFVFGDDGCGNYYLIDTARGKTTVLFYDHEVDTLTRRAQSFLDFLQRSERGLDFEDVVLHSGGDARQKAAARRKWRPPTLKIGPRTPRWQYEWRAFVGEFMTIMTQAKDESDLIRRINRKFASKPVCWSCRVTELSVGNTSKELEAVHVAFEPFRKRAMGMRLKFGRQVVGLRTERQSRSPQIITRQEAWRDVRVGSQIRLLMMTAPGDDKTPCINLHNWHDDDRREVMVNECGGHVAEILKPPRKARRSAPR